MRIHLLEPDRFSDQALKDLRSLGQVTFGEDWKGLYGSEVIFVRLARMIDRNFLSKFAPKIKFILSPTTGHDHLDTSYFITKGIKLISLRGEVDFLGGIPSTAEHTWALLLSLMRKLPQAVQHVNQKGWNRDLFIGNNLSGKNIGILGFGRVGTQVSTYALSFGMKVHVFDVKKVKVPDGVTLYSDYESFASELDILSIHIPMDETNSGWLNRKRINQLKPGVRIINTSRGGVWDEEYLSSQVRSGRIGGVATDVLEKELTKEQLFSSSLFLCAEENYPVIITPHIAGACIESMHATEEFVVKKLIKFLNEQ